MVASKRHRREFVVDLVEWGEKTERVVLSTTRDAIMQDEFVQLALERTVEIVGEIAGRLLTQFPEWDHDRRDDLKNAYRLRNKVAHGYNDVSAQILYDIARSDVALLTAKARLWLAELPDGEP